LRHWARRLELPAEIWSAGTEKTFVKPDAIRVMQEVGIDLSAHTSKTLQDLPDPWSFDLVLTVCDTAAENCPVYPARTQRLHVSFPDPTGKNLEAWRAVRDALGRMSERLIQRLKQGQTPSEAELQEAAGLQQLT